MTTIKLKDLSGSKLFHDVMEETVGLFPRYEVSDAYAEERAMSGPPRSRVVDLVTQSMRGLELSAEQTSHLKDLSDPGSVVVTTGQQVGFLGGPFYTLLKTCSTAFEARRLETEIGRPVVPIFWLEDTDHDSLEASSASLPASDGSVEVVSHWNGTDERRSVSGRTFNDADIKLISDAVSRLDGRYADEIRSLLEEIYKSGRSWTDAFLQLIEPFLQHWGVLVVRSSDVLSSGMHGPLVQQDLKDPGALSSVISSTSADLQARGYHAQATVPDLLFFLHTDSGRHHLRRQGADYRAGEEVFTIEELRAIAVSSPGRFSPSALGRPLVQDSLLPTVSAVLGQAELAYHAQISEAYKALGILQPAPLVRHQACILDARAERNLKKGTKAVEFYFQPWEMVEYSLTNDMAEDAIPDIGDIDSLVAPWRAAAAEIDETLIKRVEATRAQITSAMESLRGKMRSALKKRDQQTLDRSHALWWWLYPNGGLNERAYPLALLMSRLGSGTIRIIAERTCEENRTSLTIIGPSDIESKDT